MSNNNAGVSFESLRVELLQNEEVKAEYDFLESEYVAVKQMIMNTAEDVNMEYR